MGVRRWRPFLRRAAKTLRPPLVFMRARKPCVCGGGALSVETCVSAKNSPPLSRQLDRIKTFSVVEALKTVKDRREFVLS